MLTAAIATIMMAGCSKNSAISTDGTNGGEQGNGSADERQELVLGVRQATLKTDVKTKGIGGIGGTTDADNKWDGEMLYIYALSTDAADLVPMNVAATAPSATGTGAIAWATPGSHYYYGGKSVCSFYGYHIDNAIASGNNAPTGDASVGYSIPFQLDGTQDLMVATTDRTKDITDAIANGGNSTELTGKETSLYSAWSARRNVIPNLIFKHLLSRLKFTVKAGNASTVTAQVSITKIEVYSKSQGTLVVVPSVDGITVLQGLKDVMELPGDLIGVTPFQLKQAPNSGGDRELVDLTSVLAVASAVSVGESMLVIPADTYKMTVTTSQVIDGTPTTGIITTLLEKPIKSGIEAASFDAGKVYTINIIVYGLEEIKVNATLTAWEDGGSIDVDPDDQP